MPSRRAASTVRIRRHRRGDVGWLLERHAVVYPAEFGYKPEFETYVAQSLIPFLERNDRVREALWIAELDGKRVGSIAIHLDPERPGWAKLRWVLLEREARGFGLGQRLMATSLRFARKQRYRGVHLLTVDDLAAARHLYAINGFVRTWVDPEPCPWAPWGREETWEVRFQTKRRKRAAQP